MKIGDPVLVRYVSSRHDSFCFAKVIRVGAGSEDAIPATMHEFKLVGDVRDGHNRIISAAPVAASVVRLARTEGQSWARGWHTKEANALRALALLEASS